LNKSYQPQPFSFFSPLTTSLFAGNFSSDHVDKRYNVVNVLSVKGNDVNRVKDALQNTAADYAPTPDYRPETKFEARGKRLGHGVWDLVFRKK